MAPATDTSNGNLSQPAAKIKKLNPYKLREMETRRRQLEEEITKAEHEIAECEQAALTFVSAQETIRITTLLDQRRRDLEQLMSEWEEVSQSLETAT